MTNEDNTSEFAEIDYDREKRTGFPEVIFGETKTPEQSSKIAKNSTPALTGLPLLIALPSK